MTFAIIHFLLYIKYNGNIEKLEQKHIYSIPGFMWKGKGCVCVCWWFFVVENYMIIAMLESQWCRFHGPVI